MIFDPAFNESGIYLNPALISYCSPVQDRMAGASTSVYECDSMVRGQHIYRSVHVWTSLTDWCSKCIPVWEDDNHDKCAINNQL